MENKNYPKWYDLATATIGTIGQYTFIHPIWSAKISAQTHDKPPLKLSVGNLPALYRGYWLHVMRALPVSATQIYVGNSVRKLFPVSNEQITSFYSGCLGGVMSAPIVTVTDAIMTQQKHKAASAAAVTKSIYKERGLSGFFSGLTSTAIRNGGRSAAYFSVFPWTYDVAVSATAGYSLSKNEKAVAANVVATSVSGLFATVATNPPDVIKTVQQNALLDKKQKTVLSTTEAIKQIYQTRGPLGFFSGVTHRLASRTIEVFIMGQALKTVPKVLDAMFGDDGAGASMKRP